MNRTMMFRAAAFACAVWAFVLPICGAESDLWVEFENGKRLYREKEFGEALNAFRRAAGERRRMFEAAARGLPPPWIRPRPGRPRAPYSR
jgi:hypothetical protein